MLSVSYVLIVQIISNYDSCLLLAVQIRGDLPQHSSHWFPSSDGIGRGKLATFSGAVLDNHLIMWTHYILMIMVTILKNGCHHLVLFVLGAGAVGEDGADRGLVIYIQRS